MDESGKRAAIRSVFLPGSVETKALRGYSKALGLVFDDYRCQSLGEGFIKNRHRLLRLDVDPSYGGYYKTELYPNDRRGMGNVLSFCPGLFDGNRPFDWDGLSIRFGLGKPEVNPCC